MRTLFEYGPVEIKGKNDRLLVVREDGFSFNDGKNKNFDVVFDNIRWINAGSYCNSNSSYLLLLKGTDDSNIEITTDTAHINGCHNIFETKTLLTGFAASKLTKEFPNNIDTLDIEMGFSLKEKVIRISKGVISGAKNSINIADINRVVCVTNGALTRFGIYTSTKKKLFNTPNMVIPCNEVTAPLLEAIVTRNTGKGIDFSRGNGFDQKTSEFVLIRYLDSDFFVNEDGRFREEWQQVVHTRLARYGYDVRNLIERMG